jgi:hypothetical protein
MDNASGRFCYIEDPDGTLIELVETHKVPILKKVGWYLIAETKSRKPLPDWMMLALSKVKMIKMLLYFCKTIRWWLQQNKSNPILKLNSIMLQLIPTLLKGARKRNVTLTNFVSQY